LTPEAAGGFSGATETGAGFSGSATPGTSISAEGLTTPTSPLSTPSAAGTSWWDTIKGYSDNPYVQQGFKTLREKLEEKKQQPSPMQFSPMAAPIVPTGSDALDKLAWLRAFNVQG